MRSLRLGLATLLGLIGLAGIAGLPAGARAANPAQFAITVSMVPAPVPAVSKTVTPAVPGIGGPLAYRIVVTNGGAGTVTSLTVVDTVSPVFVNPVTDQPGGFGAPVVTQVPGAGTRYEWSAGSLSMGPNASLTFTITGQAGFVCAAQAVSNTAYVIATGPGGTAAVFSPSAGFVLQPAVAALSVAKFMAPVSPVVGGPVTYTLVVTNTGAATVTSLVVTDTVSPVVTGAATQQPAPFGAPAVVSGTSGTLYAWSAAVAMTPGLTYTFTVSGTVGPVTATTTIGNTAYASGAAGCAPVQDSAPGPAFTVAGAAALVATATATPSPVCSGAPVLVVVNITNTGTVAANGVNVSPFLTSGGGSFGAFAGPTPALPAVIPGGGSQSFSWTTSGGVSGAAWVTTTATGTDAVSLLPVASGAATTGVVTVNAPAVLAGALSVPPTASVGQTVTVAMTVTNTGDVNATGVGVSATTSAGSGTFGAVPASQTIAPAGSWTYAWSYTVGTAGTNSFSVTASGLTCGSTPVSILGTGTLNAVAAAAFSATLIVTTPGTTVQGRLVVVTLTVTNTGSANANGVTANLTPGGVTGTFGGPIPAGPVVIAGGGSAQTFIWTYTTTGAGGLSFNASAGGTDANSGSPVGTGGLTSSGITVQTQAQLVVSSLDVLAGIRVGEVLSATVTVQNTGQADANGVTMVRLVGDPNGALGAPSPAMPAPFTLVGGASSSFAWVYPSTSCGPLTVSLTVTGTEALTGAPLFASAMASSGVAGLPSFVVMSANPARGKVGTLSTISVTVYDSCAPAQRVPGVAVSLAVILGNGVVEAPAGTTSTSGVYGSRFRLGTTVGTNGVRADVAGTTGGTVFVEGTTPGEVQDFLTKNFFDPRRGQKVQVRVFVPAAVRVSVRVYNLAAELIRVVREEDVQPGLTAWEWDGRNEAGQIVGNGTYFIQIVAGKDTQIRRVIVLKQ
ncbi:MAG: FlgD immunoglobulin-like domain containing protein [Candidatus Coatesbacteria bacterium]